MPKKPRPSKAKPYHRKDSPFLWLPFVDVAGKRRPVSSETTDEATAQAMLDALRARVAAERKAGLTTPEAPTVRWYAESRWLPARRLRKVATVEKDEQRLRHHVYPLIGHLLLKDASSEDVQLVVDAVAAKGLSPRMVHHVYGGLRVMFKRAIKDKLRLNASPCVLTVRDGDLPEKTDKNPFWRATAVYSRDELEILISDERIPEYRRVLWALLLIGGMRVNEATPRRWGDYDALTEPLGRLSIVSHWDPETGELRPGSKTSPHGRPVPVHPVLARILARWKLSGWAAMSGRNPGPEDLIIEAPRGGFLSSIRTLSALKDDCATVGIRERAQHDMRRTFVSLALADGANPKTLRVITHGPSKKEILDIYNVPPWASLCAEMAKLKVGLREGRTLELPATLLLRSGD